MNQPADIIHWVMMRFLKNGNICWFDYSRCISSSKIKKRKRTVITTSNHYIRVTMVKLNSQKCRGWCNSNSWLIRIMHIPNIRISWHFSRKFLEPSNRIRYCHFSRMLWMPSYFRNRSLLLVRISRDLKLILTNTIVTNTYLKSIKVLELTFSTV